MGSRPGVAPKANRWAVAGGEDWYDGTVAFTETAPGLARTQGLTQRRWFYWQRTVKLGCVPGGMNLPPAVAPEGAPYVECGSVAPEAVYRTVELFFWLERTDACAG
jgi:hypothetical protein